MKKLFTLLFIILSVGLLVSCSNSEDVVSPQTNQIKVTFENVAVVDGVVYTTRTYPLEIESIALNAKDGSTKAISEAKYSIDSETSTISHFTPFSGRINTTDLTAGSHTLELSFELLQNDNSSVPEDILYAIEVVPSIADLPNDAELGTYTRIFRQ
ncbi:MAG: hypothetical protein K2J70_06055 [Muribaculaceae bacterium]|nr:hypothetical protein [Muribaculaceae bacterium]